MQLKAFNPSRTELQTGINLIEASAGTGKTYAIAMLVLRFVVELSIDLKQILVVTFTKAATEELKERIRSRLMAAKQALNMDYRQVERNLRDWLDSLELDRSTISLRLELALLDIDQAAIFTIHGFCQRVLAEHVLESGQMFDMELSTNISAIRQQCADDFWRKQLYCRPAWQTALLTYLFATPDQLLASLNGISFQQSVYPDLVDIDAALDSLQNRIYAAADSFKTVLKQIEIIQQAGMFNDSYSKPLSERTQALIAWFADLNAEPADFFWLTSAGLLAGLNGRKFLVSKSKPLPSDQQKQLYLDSVGLDSSAFDNLAAGLQNLQVVFRRALLGSLQTELNQLLLKNNVLSFDDLISRLYQVLSGAKGQFLITELQKQYAVALIDEFQDTDQQQWQNFSQIFADPRQFLYLIGDPKQAIYKFRGADIHSYFQAQKQAQHHYTLLQNWRSHPALVAGVNRLFQRPESFLFQNLIFNPVQAAHSAADGRVGIGAPLLLWQLNKNVGNLQHWGVGKAAGAIREAVVEEILVLLDHAELVTAENGSQDLMPKHIAILVRSNSQAAEYQQALNAVGIPAVINSKQSVFAAPEAQRLYAVLLAIAQAGHLPTLKQALTVDWFNLDGQQLYTLFNDEVGLDVYLNRFQQYLQLWQEQGLLTMMFSLLEQEKIAVQLCSCQQAERALTNLYHLIERLQQASIDEHLSINKTLDWLHQAIQQAAQDNSEDRQLRLESDEDTVKIVTLHGSKGLEYPVVFCPGLWQRGDRLKTEQFLVQCHENGAMIADLGSEQFAQRREQALYEELAEDLRLLYVAVTRAKYRCYICWADVRTKDQANDSALAYLLEFSSDDFAAQQQKLQALTAELPQVFAYKLLAADTLATGYYQSRVTYKSLACRQRQRHLHTHWQMSSYTALSALSLQDTPELPADKAVEPFDKDTSDLNLAVSLINPVEITTADNLPKGAVTGNVVHSLLETVSFERLAVGADISAAREQAMRKYGLQLSHPELLDELLQTVVNSPLSKDDTDFRLKNLPAGQCLKEMPFYLAMQQGVDTNRINRIMSALPAYQTLSTKQMSGYLTGFIDLIFVYQGKYYVLDYKTNTLPDYQAESLIQAMRQHNYGLQYCLYSLVLDRYLQQRLPDYDYAQHFGGVKYLFVRGMQVTKPGFAVFADLPTEKLLRELGEIFFATG